VLVSTAAGAPFSFTPTGSLNTWRDQHTATLLQNGKVLVAGGTFAPNLQTHTAELYDSATGQWTGTGNLSGARQAHSATLLHNGKVLVTGGYISDFISGAVTYLSTAQTYDPNTGVWTATGSMFTPRSGHTATFPPTSVPDGPL
jgi:N-acetylneuraminic acid mutarotase